MDGTCIRKVACSIQGSWVPRGWPNDARVVPPVCRWQARNRYSYVPPVVCSSSLFSLATIAARISFSVGGRSPVRRAATVSCTTCSRIQPPVSPCNSTTRVRRMATRILANRLGSALSGGTPLSLALSGGTPFRFLGPPTRRTPSATDRAANQPFRAAHASSSSGSGHTPAWRSPRSGEGVLRRVETHQAAPTEAAPNY